MPNYHKVYQMAIKTYQMFVKYYKWPKNTRTFSIPKPSKIYPNKDFWFGNIPPSNPAVVK
jgi:hypothetical protein